jgi:predicted DNA-binding protein with PD1-like motif
MKLEPVEIIRGGTVTCTFAADAGKDVNMLIYAILDQKNIEEFTMTANGSLQNFRISTAPLPPGEYMVKVQCGRDFKSGKFNVV